MTHGGSQVERASTPRCVRAVTSRPHRASRTPGAGSTQNPRTSIEIGRGPGRAFWVTKHGPKMTGMAAWGPTHDDDAIWSLVAFLQKMPDMDAEMYRKMVMRSEAGHGH